MRKNLFIRVPEEFKIQLKLKAVYEKTTLNELDLRVLKKYVGENFFEKGELYEKKDPYY